MVKGNWKRPFSSFFCLISIGTLQVPTFLSVEKFRQLIKPSCFLILIAMWTIIILDDDDDDVILSLSIIVIFFFFLGFFEEGC